MNMWRSVLIGQCDQQRRGDTRHAARRITPDQLAALEAALQDCEAAAAASDPEAYYAANGIFHRLIYQASGNSFLAREAETLLQRLRPFRRLQLQARGRMGQSLAEHRAILQALASGADGLDDIRSIVAQAPSHLLPGGWLLLEHGWDQAEAVQALLRSAGFAEVQSRLTPRWNANTVYYSLVQGLSTLASRLIARTQGLALPDQMRISLLAAGLIGGYAVWRSPQVFHGIGSVPLGIVPIAVLLVGGAVGVLLSNNRLTAVIVTGLTGFGSAAAFLALRAPDLALTQLLVEAVTVILFLLAFRYLPGARDLPRARGRLVLDAGSKTLGADKAAWASGYGRLLDHPQARVVILSEHHAVVEMPEGTALPPLGSVVRVVPNHACNAVNLADELVVVRHRDGEATVTGTWAVAARNRNA